LSNTPNKRGKTNVSAQSSNSRRRKGPVKGSCGIQAHGRREIWSAILHHQPRREDCRIYPFEEWQRIEEKLAKLSNFIPPKEEFFDQDELLRATVEIDDKADC